MALLVTAADHPEPAAADVEVRQRNGRVIVTLTDRESSPEEIERATDKAGLDITVREQPAGPSNVGRFVGYVESAGAVDQGFVRGDATTFATFSLPSDWPGRLTLSLGRPAAPGEAYRAFSDAYAEGEPLACSATLGRPLEQLAPHVEGLDVRVAAYTDGMPSGQVPLDEALGTTLAAEPVTDATALSASDLIVSVGGPERREPPADC